MEVSFLSEESKENFSPPPAAEETTNFPSNQSETNFPADSSRPSLRLSVPPDSQLTSPLLEISSPSLNSPANENSSRLTSGRSLAIFLIGLMLLFAPLLTSIAMSFSLYIQTFEFRCSSPSISFTQSGDLFEVTSADLSIPIFCCFHPAIHYFFIYSLSLSMILIGSVVFGCMKIRSDPLPNLSTEISAQNSPAAAAAASSPLRVQNIEISPYFRLLRFFDDFLLHYFRPFISRLIPLTLKFFSFSHFFLSLSMIIWSSIIVRQLSENSPPHVFVGKKYSFHSRSPESFTKFYPIDEFCTISKAQIAFFAFSDFLILFVGAALLIRFFSLKISVINRVINYFDRIDIISVAEIELNDVQYDDQGNPLTNRPGLQGLEKENIEKIPIRIVACKSAREKREIQNSANSSDFSLQIEPENFCSTCEENFDRLIFIQSAQPPVESPNISRPASPTPIDQNISNFVPRVLSPLSSDSLDVCSICLDPFRFHSEVKQLKCKHIFHASELDSWLFRVNKCPLCRSNAWETKEN